MTDFFHVEQVPVFCNVLWETHKKAMACPETELIMLEFNRDRIFKEQLKETLPDGDFLFNELVYSLNRCSAQRENGCDDCPKHRECNQVWNLISEMSARRALPYRNGKGGFVMQDVKVQDLIRGLTRIMGVAENSKQS